ncbi:MAG TPA: acyl-CoA synthetase FdrA [Alphaproteobacteria bacterium]|nr:acyl-CoA synthetase FdrA [Alphaproteobacteria bacterium]
MANLTKVIRNFYRDSVSLMQLSARLAKLPGVAQASAVMASANNLALLSEAGLLGGAASAGPNDLFLALAGESEEALAAALAEAEALLRESAVPAPGGTGERGEPPRSIEMALRAFPAANLALISTPGEYAVAEALKALRLGLNVMLFSDNVALADEAFLKRYAQVQGLLVMGPDCGTAIISGTPLGFANVVRRGDIGIVAASGTGLQQVTCLIDRLGKGVSQAIGTGGHDLHAAVGGITMQHGIDALAADPATRVIVLISKPPAEAVAERVLALARRAGKPVVVNFLGADPAALAGGNLTAAKTLEDAARAAVALANGAAADNAPWAAAESAPLPQLAQSQRFIRGLYSGGTFCYEASLLLGEVLAPVYSNTPVGSARALEDVWHSRAHTLIDLGDDLFTRGRPHPMIDHRLRNERLLKEAADPEVAVILLDVVLGYGSHPDPAGEIAPVVREALAQAAKGGRALAVVGFVCGTAGDPQGLARQEEALSNAGMRLSNSNAGAVRLAARIAGEARALEAAALGGRRSLP